MDNAVTVADLIRQLSALPQDARVVLHGSNETYDGFSHPGVVLDENGTVHVCEHADLREQDEPEGWEDSYDEEDPYDVINAMLPAE